jgi:hypothetical protein
MNSLFQLEIPKRNGQCAYQGERLLPGMEIYSLLIEEETQHLARRDFCSACWNQVRAIEEKQSSTRGYWKSKIEKRKTSAETSRIERALALLHILQQAPEPQAAEIFVLCLFLAHARQLALRQEFHKEGVTYHLYEILHKEEFVTVRVINLSQVQIETLQKSLADQLQSL